jgi:hypothetical protein
MDASELTHRARAVRMRLTGNREDEPTGLSELGDLVVAMAEEIDRLRARLEQKT